MNRVSSNPRLLQWIDHRIGAPVCAVLTGLRRVARLFRPTAAKIAPARKILFLKFAEQGSTVLAYDTIRRATERVGRENVYFVVFEENRFILDLLELIPPENVFALQTRSAAAMLSSCMRHLAAIRRRGIDTCIDLEFFARSAAAFSFLCGARVRVGFHAYYHAGPYRGDLLTHRVNYNAHLHTSASFGSLLSALDVAPADLPTIDLCPPAPLPPPRFRPTDLETTQMRERLGRLGIEPDHDVFVLNANCSDLLPLRKWNERNYVQLAQRILAGMPNARIVLTGVPAEAAGIGAVQQAIGSPRCVSLAGQTTLRELMVLFTLSDVLVTNDSGPAHFAVLTPIDVVALFGPETPLLFAAPGPRSHPLWAGIACSPCVNAYNNRQTACRDNRCMKALTVDLVFNTVARVHGARPPKVAAATPA